MKIFSLVPITYRIRPSGVESWKERNGVHLESFVWWFSRSLYCCSKCSEQRQNQNRRQRTPIQFWWVSSLKMRRNGRIQFDLLIFDLKRLKFYSPVRKIIYELVRCERFLAGRNTWLYVLQWKKNSFEFFITVDTPKQNMHVRVRFRVIFKFRWYVFLKCRVSWLVHRVSPNDEVLSESPMLIGLNRTSLTPIFFFNSRRIVNIVVWCSCIF